MNGSNGNSRRSKKRVVVILGQPDWTAKAIHLACAPAHSSQSEVVLVKMIPVQHPMNLGAADGYINFSRQEQKQAREWMTIAQSYGAPCSLYVYQYASYVGGIVGVAASLDATTVLAQPYKSLLPLWSRFQQWRLREALAECGRSLQTLEQPEPQSNQVPYINLVVKSKPSSSGK
jgi:hypothetical protein